MGYLKGKSALMAYDRHPELQKMEQSILGQRIRCGDSRKHNRRSDKAVYERAI